ncbi:hypothetical protein [Prevotella pallens]|nr:hypothetical protein [Prevotella pallens]
MIVNYPGEHRSLLNVFDWAFFMLIKILAVAISYNLSKPFG